MDQDAEKRFQCKGHRDPKTGEPCKLFFTRQFNLDRHVQKIHSLKKDSSVQHIPRHDDVLHREVPRRNDTESEADALKGRSPHLAHGELQIPLTPTPPSSIIAAPVLTDTFLGHRSVDSGSNNTPQTLSNIATAQTPRNPLPSPALLRLTPPVLDTSVDPACESSLLTLTLKVPKGVSLLSADANYALHMKPLPKTNASNASAAPFEVPLASWEERRNRKRRRLIDSLEKDALPGYKVKRSRKWTLQQTGVHWITQVGKEHFDQYILKKRALWGVTEKHSSSCVSCPADWAALDPSTLAELFSFATCPLEDAEGESYQYSDHSTHLTRAVAFFADADWPRNGTELDNFLGSGPYKLMQGSHLCNQHLCIIHLVYETAEINNERKECHARARFLRSEGLDVPDHCDKHHPACLLQQAALTTFEMYLVQFSVWRAANGMSPITAPPTPRWHPYPTFEFGLPLSFCQPDSSMTLRPEHLVAHPESVSLEGKPDLTCAFCPRIKSFKSVIALWSHFVHQHHDSTHSRIRPSSKVVVATDRLLKRIRQTAALWSTYWQRFSDGGKHRNPTMLKLKQVAEEGFSWETVLSWDLR